MNRFRYYRLGVNSDLEMRHNAKGRSACPGSSYNFKGTQDRHMRKYELPDIVSQTSARVVAPIACPDAGTKKLLPFTFLSEPLAPFNTDASTLAKELLDQVPEFHELPDALTVLTRLTCALPTLTAAMLPVILDEELRMTNPVSPLFHAVFRSNVSEPGLPLSMNPFLKFANAMELRIMWLAGGLSVMPSLKPLPSPSNGLKPPATC